MSRDPDTTKPPDHYAWMADLPGRDGRVQRVALCATPPGELPQPLASGDLPTIIAMKAIAQGAANQLHVPVTLYAFRGEEVLQAVQPQLIEAAAPIDIVDLSKHN